MLLLAFVPILCITIAQRELVDRHPDCGAAFVWVGRALGPRTGWIVAWTIVASTLLALANLAKVVGVYAFLLVDAPDLANSTIATLAVGLLALGGGHRHRAARPAVVLAAADAVARRQPGRAAGVRGGRHGQGLRRHRRSAGGDPTSAG